MNRVSLSPNPRYLLKLIVSAIISLIFPFGAFFIFAAVENITMIQKFTSVYSILALFSAIVMIVSYLHYRSIRYEIHDDEIIVYSGFLNKSVKHVNFRNVTNMELKRTFIDRLLGIGSLSIQTAGSGSVIPEEKLAGLDNVQDVYEFLAQQLRDYRSDSVTPATSHSINTLNNQQISIQMLRELRAIRSLLSQ
jgi:uncharacterized membrane protein YdbT with pleckstrin-like domain